MYHSYISLTSVIAAGVLALQPTPPSSEKAYHIEGIIQSEGYTYTGSDDEPIEQAYKFTMLVPINAHESASYTVHVYVCQKMFDRILNVGDRVQITSANPYFALNYLIDIRNQKELHLLTNDQKRIATLQKLFDKGKLRCQENR